MEIKIHNGKNITAEPGKSVYQTLRDNGVYLVASCGGKGVCGKCRVMVREGTYKTESPAKLEEKEIGDKIAVAKSKGLIEFLRAEDPSLTPMVRKIQLTLMPPSIEDNLSDLERIKRALVEHEINGMRFSHGFVQHMAGSLRRHNWSVYLTYTENLEAISVVSPERARHYGLAVDIGTTTVVVYLVDCTDGTLLDSGVTYNSQMRHGDDVITRIIHATEGGALTELRTAVVNDLNGLLSPMIRTEPHQQ